MSALTLDEIVAAIRFRGDYQNVRKFPATDLQREAQQSFAEFYELVANTYEGYWDTSATGDTVAGTDYVSLPPDCWRVQGIDRQDGSQYIEIAQIGLNARNRFPSQGQPLGYRLTARGVDLFPTPDAVYTLRVMYTPRAPALQKSQPREWYNGWEDYVITATLLRLDEREGKPLGDRKDTLDRVTKRITAGATHRRSQEPEYLNLRELATSDPFDDGIF